MTNPKDKSGSDHKAPVDTTPLNGVPNLETVFEINDRLLANLAAISSAMFEFNRMRMKHAAALSGALAGITNLGEAMELQNKYTRAVIEDGLSAAGKIAALSMGGLVDSLATAAAPAQRPGGAQHSPLAEAAE